MTRVICTGCNFHKFLIQLKTMYLQGFWSKYQVFWDPIKNRVSPRSALPEAVYLKALL